MKQPCGCCSGIEVLTPEAEMNRPGLPALVYRAGTYATFLETMLARLSGVYVDVPTADGSGTLQRIFPLRALTTRDLSDPSVALLDAWATVADVLTFYQERIANEGFLRTATERRSILELARLVGYRLRPGVSASVYLGFTVVDGFAGTIPAGTRAQSVPGAGEKPQFFETYQDLTARDSWNNLKPRLTRPQLISLASDSNKRPIDPGTDARTRDTIYLQGIANNLNAGDFLLFVLGDAADQQVLRQVESVELDAAKARTEVALLAPAEGDDGNTPGAIVSNAVDPFIEEATSIFADSELAAQVAQILQQLESNAQAAPDTQTAAEMVAGVLPSIREKHAIAVRRRFTRLEPWLAHLAQGLARLVETLPSDETGGGARGTAQPVMASLAPSPLETLFTLLEPLQKPPSLQPANTLRLKRTIAEAFSPQSDTAPRLLAAFHPSAAKTLYKAWGGVQTPQQEVEVFAMRVKTAPFGNNAPLKPQIADGTVKDPIEWDLDGPDTNTSVLHLDAVYDKILPGSWVVVIRADNGGLSAPDYLQIQSIDQISRADYGMSAKCSRLTLNVPWTDPLPTGPKLSILRGVTVLAQAEALELAEEPLDIDVAGAEVELAGLYDGLESGRWVIVSGDRTDIAGTTGVTASELVMVSSVVQGTRGPACAVFPDDFTPFAEYLYTTDANSFGDRLIVGQLSVSVPDLQQRFPNPPQIPNQLYCDQVQLAAGVYASAYVPTQDELQGNFSPFDGLLVDPATNLPYPKGQIPVAGAVGSPVFAWRISTQPVHTILKLANSLAYTYDSGSVNLYGNVVKATHGQSQGEVLGNGDATASLQRFPLHQAPLTYLPAPTASGAESTLSVRVNEVEWHEAENLFALGPADRSYITQNDDSDNTTVITGTGEHGLRVPTGTANVKAVYRSGTGKAGNVDERQISQLATQPPGVKSVINPLPAAGGADGDTRDQARRNVPIGTAALDRLVSVPDYADFARRFAGIGKASSVRLSDGRRLLIHLTIAGKDDIPITPTTDLYQALVLALAQAGDPHQPLQIALRRLKLLVINAAVKVKPDYVWESVAPAVRSALLNLYAFDNRDLGQSAFLSEAVSTIQGTAGVEYVDMRTFDFVPESVTAQQLASLAGNLKPRSFVEAELAHIDPTAGDPAKRILPAELVILTPDIPDTLILTELTT